jgi:hypothetical protein
MFISKKKKKNSGQIRNFYCRVENASQKVCGGKLKLDKKKLRGGGLGVGDVCHYVKFWGRITRTCFPAKIGLFYEIRKLKEEEE